jgi:hypothetical protein
MQPLIVNELFSENEEIMEFMKVYGNYPVYAESMKMQLTGLCPQCEKNGIPKIALRNRDSYQLKTGRYGIPDTQTVEKEKKPEYWLCYWHGKSHQHWIQQYQGNIEGSFKRNKKKEIDNTKFLLGKAIRIKTGK